MQQTYARILLPCLSFALLPCMLAPAQEPADPKALMLAAAKLNNLATSDAKPWHIKASFRLFDDQGTVTDEGTYEEFWAGPTKFKRIFAGKAFTETMYGSEKGDMRADAHGDVPSILLNARQDLVGPLPNENALEHSSYTAKSVDTGETKLTCLTTASSVNGVRVYSPTYCVGTTEPILRIFVESLGTAQTLRNRILRFEGHTIAGDLKVVRSGKPVLTQHVDTVENLSATEDALFTPPSNAVLAPRLVAISAGIAQGMLQYSVPPEYPVQAKIAHITGTVVLRGVIGKDGHIKDLKVVQGPDALQVAATDAVRQWRYRPYLLNGEPVEVDTTINVVFQMGN